jgi:hypothetical protein
MSCAATACPCSSAITAIGVDRLSQQGPVQEMGLAPAPGGAIGGFAGVAEAPALALGAA